MPRYVLEQGVFLSLCENDDPDHLAWLAHTPPGWIPTKFLDVPPAGSESCKACTRPMTKAKLMIKVQGHWYCEPCFDYFFDESDLLTEPSAESGRDEDEPQTWWYVQ